MKTVTTIKKTIDVRKISFENKLLLLRVNNVLLLPFFLVDFFNLVLLVSSLDGIYFSYAELEVSSDPYDSVECN